MRNEMGRTLEHTSRDWSVVELEHLWNSFGSKLTRTDLVFGGGQYTTILKGYGLFKMAETLNQSKFCLKAVKFLLLTR
ncbi:hypothetical protein BGX21_003152, partial [Mortierella sp. AD011]